MDLKRPIGPSRELNPKHATFPRRVLTSAEFSQLTAIPLLCAFQPERPLVNWRQWLGLTPTVADLARELLRAAQRSGVTGWSYDAADTSLRNADHGVINLANIHREYAQARYLARPGLLQKYHAMLTPSDQSKVPRLRTLAQTRIFPILRSRNDRVTLEIQHRDAKDPFPPRAAKTFLSHLEVVNGYDRGQTVSQVKASAAPEWGLSLELAIERARANLRALPAPTWQLVGDAVWQLQSDEGYNESFLQLPKVFENLPAKGSALAMIPNRGVLLATGSDEPAGITALLAAARKSIEEAPWPLCGDLFRITPAGPELYVPIGDEAIHLATIQRLDIASVYEAQKTVLQKHCEALGDPVYVATYGIISKTSSPDDSHSWCSWAERVESLLPATDLIAFGWQFEDSRKTLMVRWTDAGQMVGHYFKPTIEDPPRFRVDEFPTPEERDALQRVAV